MTPPTTTTSTPTSTPTVVPALVRGEVRHARFHPVKHAFRYRAHQWLVDVDSPEVAPRWLRGLVSFQARDHIGSPDASLGANVRAFVAAQGVSWTAARVVMLANARVLGYVFDPLSVYWCYDAQGRLEGVLAEVHNTYGERHGYVVEVDDQGSARTAKALYVSPFFGVFGDYQLKFVNDGGRLGAFVTLLQDDKVVFTGSFTGEAQPITIRRILGVAVTQPLMPQRVALLIRVHGVWLWLRKLPVVRRLAHDEQLGAR
ncbi:MAG: DUF1365 domain-containing protein [Propionibacteriales bacterium]|nr:DUF1365 domain-containing protein [Propionibacteriales bacterium]